MITGLIAAIILIAVLPPAIDHGQTLTIVIALAISGFLLLLGAAGRDCDNAESYFIDYWAKGGPDGRGGRTEAEECTETIEYIYDPETEMCPACGGHLGLRAIIRNAKGPRRSYLCSSCGRTFTEKKQ